MSDTKTNEIGSITWTDLSVKNADQVKEFYTEVVGWKSEPVDMGGYNDFNMNTANDGNTVAGICHSKGVNAELPPQWLIYITVENVESSAQRCEELEVKFYRVHRVWVVMVNFVSFRIQQVQSRPYLSLKSKRFLFKFYPPYCSYIIEFHTTAFGYFKTKQMSYNIVVVFYILSKIICN